MRKSAHGVAYFRCPSTGRGEIIVFVAFEIFDKFFYGFECGFKGGLLHFVMAFFISRRIMSS
jgi:hypothetical protein